MIILIIIVMMIMINMIIILFISRLSLPSSLSLASSLAQQLDIGLLVYFFRSVPLPTSCLVFVWSFRVVVLLVHQLDVS